MQIDVGSYEKPIVLKLAILFCACLAVFHEVLILNFEHLLNFLGQNSKSAMAALIKSIAPVVYFAPEKPKITIFFASITFF